LPAFGCNRGASFGLRPPSVSREPTSRAAATASSATIAPPMTASPQAPESPVVIGWKEYLALPELGIPRIKAKVDTGARSSALHVEGLTVLERHPDGTSEVAFDVPLGRREPIRRVRCTAHVLREARITDSSGDSEVRPVIVTEMRLGPVRKKVLLTLTDRAGMLFRILLGRKALEGDFVVDVSRKYLLLHAARPPVAALEAGR